MIPPTGPASSIKPQCANGGRGEADTSLSHLLATCLLCFVTGWSHSHAMWSVRVGIFMNCGSPHPSSPWLPFGWRTPQPAPSPISAPVALGPSLASPSLPSETGHLQGPGQQADSTAFSVFSFWGPPHSGTSELQSREAWHCWAPCGVVGGVRTLGLLPQGKYWCCGAVIQLKMRYHNRHILMSCRRKPQHWSLFIVKKTNIIYKLLRMFCLLY